MAIYRNADNTTGFYYESGTYANATGTLQWLGAVQDFTSSDDPKNTPIRYHGTGNRNFSQLVSTGKLHNGKVTFMPQDWRSALFALGSCVDTSGSTSTHVISELNGGAMAPNVSGTENPFTSFQLYHHKNVPGTGLADVRTYLGANCNTWALTIPQGGILSVDLGWIAQSCTYGSGAVASITENTSRPFISADCKLHLPSGTVLSLMNTATLSINNNLDAKQHANGSVWITPPVPGNRDYMLDTGLDMNSTIAKSLFEQYLMGGSSVNALLDVTVSASRYGYFTMSGGKLMTLTSDGGTEGTVTQTLGYKPQTMSITAGDTIVKYNAW